VWAGFAPVSSSISPGRVADKGAGSRPPSPFASPGCPNSRPQTIFEAAGVTLSVVAPRQIMPLTCTFTGRLRCSQREQRRSGVPATPLPWWPKMGPAKGCGAGGGLRNRWPQARAGGFGLLVAGSSGYRTPPSRAPLLHPRARKWSVAPNLGLPYRTPSGATANGRSPRGRADRGDPVGTRPGGPLRRLPWGPLSRCLP
jgi:hypothetical protein